MEFLRNFVRDAYMGARRQMPVATRRAYLPALSSSQIFSSAKPPVTTPGAVAGLAGRVAGPIMMIEPTIEQAKKVFNPDDNILTSLRDLGSGISNVIHGRPYLEGRSPRTYPNAPRLEQYNPPGFDPNQPVTLADLRKTVQETGPVGSAPSSPVTPFTAPSAPVTAFTAPPAPRLSPQDRAYQQERARVEAMVKTNPDMQKQEIAEARAKVRDKGMEEWAKANPELAAKVMPGQSGFSAIQGFVGGVGAPTTGPASAALQASPELNPAGPTFVGGEGSPILRELSPELIEKFQEQLLKQAK